MAASSPTPTVPAGQHPTIASMIAVDHIAAAIASYATRPTLAALMRVNRRFYDVAAKPLYTTVAVYEDTVESLLYPIIPKKTDTDRTKMNDGKSKDKDGSTANKQMQRKINKKKKKGMGSKSVNAAAAAAENDNAREDEPTADLRDPATDKNKNNIRLSNDHASARTPKSELLGHIRVLTIGSHPKWVCDSYAEALATYATGIDVVRVVQFPLHMYVTRALCEHGRCPFLGGLKPRKLVVRNCSGDAVPFPAMWKMPSSIKEVVLVLPTIRDRYAGREGKGPMELGCSLTAQFSTARDIKIVFWPDWDLSIGRDQALVDPTIVDRTQLIFVDDITRVLKYATYHPGGLYNTKPDVTIYGFVNLKLTDLGDSQFVRKYNQENPNAPGAPNALPNGGLHMITKRQLETLEIIYWAPPGGTAPPQVLGCALVRFKTLEGYIRNTAARVGEISEWD